MESQTPQNKEHKIEPGSIFCLFGMSICIIFGLAIGIILSQENKNITKENNTPAPLPPPPTANNTETALNTPETPTSPLGYVLEDNSTSI